MGLSRFNRLLVPLDGSPLAALALPAAGVLASVLSGPAPTVAMGCRASCSAASRTR